MAEKLLRKARQKNHDQFDAILAESTTTILHEVARLKRIVSEFSDFARMPKPVLKAVDLAGLIRDTVKRYGTTDGIPVACHLPPTLPLIRGDAEQLTQVPVNLIKNAQEAVETNASPQITMRVEVGERLGGVLNYYYRPAAWPR